jgi:hypothetical protein
MDVRAAIENYLAVLATRDDDGADKIDELIVSLDDLARVSHQVKFTFDKRDYSDPPPRDYKALRDDLTKLFPTLGYYNIALDISDKIDKSTLSVGDAIDDIADIASDLNKVIW